MAQDKKNIHKIKRTNRCTNEVLKWINIEEHMFRQRAKLEWLKLGDGNNAYFHATLKSKHKQTQMVTLHASNGHLLNTQTDIDEEVLGFYGILMGTTAIKLQGVDIMAMRQGTQLTLEHSHYFTSQVSKNEILLDFKGMSDLTTPVTNGYGAKFFKETWDITKANVINVVKEFSKIKSIGL